ncbi:MAG: MaoC family dehydratase [Myxococcota bacterium]|jgi:acyl dehydratase|nr:MaoC family dehydratase [Myxococcota bacterium]
MPGGPPLPQELTAIEGPLPDGVCEGSILGLGPHAGGVEALVALGLVPPDVVTAMTLHLLARQPRRPRSEGKKIRGAIEGGVWVREQVTFHAPMRIDEPVRVTGEAIGRFSRKGRRYGVTRSTTVGEDGRLLVSSCTTGLLSYRREPGLEDAYHGVAEHDHARPGPDISAAAQNPCLHRLAETRPGDVITGERARVTLAMMQQRDAGRDDNPIHTDPAVAEREGLSAPIAGGAHVLSFLQTRLMEAWGPECLLHGAHFDVRWVGQTYADSHIVPSARVVEVTGDQIVCELSVEGEERTLLRGKMILPLAGGGPG